jgi:hypothetical protein
MERFYATVEHFRKSGDVFDLGDGYTSLLDLSSRSAGRDYLPPEIGQSSSEVLNP